MCGQWGERGSFRAMGHDGRGPELSREDVRQVVAQVGRWKPAVTFFGGEPLMNPEIIEMVRCVKGAGLRANVITNGTLLGKMSADLVQSGIDEVIVSLDGPQDVHDRMRGRAGTYERVTQGIECLAREKRNAGRAKPVINVNATIWEGNHGRLSELVPRAARLGVSTLTFHHPTFLGRDDYGEHERLIKELYGVVCCDFTGFVREEPPAIDVDLLLEEKQRAERLENGIKVSFYPNYTEREIREYYTDIRFSPRSYPVRCLSPWMVVYVFPNGDLRPCLSLGVTFGNIHEDSIERMLNGERARKFRQDLKARGMFPACARCTELCRF
jgi:radical SAM protein with 4Fe4S-binding SPASM domain